jgi:hypothetical protein
MLLYKQSQQAMLSASFLVARVFGIFSSTCCLMSMACLMLWLLVVKFRMIALIWDSCCSFCEVEYLYIVIMYHGGHSAMHNNPDYFRVNALLFSGYSLSSECARPASASGLFSKPAFKSWLMCSRHGDVQRHTAQNGQ